jgi:diacylglycerol kinase (ATP)
MSSSVCVVVNPAAGRGRGARVVERVRDAFSAVGVDEIRITSAAGDEKTLTRGAVDSGFTTIVAVGGDGTWSNVANAILESGSDARLVLMAAGTGNDFAKTAGVPARDFEASARLAVEGGEVRVDVGRIEESYFLNIAGFGFDIAVLEDVERIPWLTGDALYYCSALRQLLGYRGIEIRVDPPLRSGTRARHLMLVVANARHFGGAFHIAPEASLTDGRLDAISILDTPPLRRFSLFGAVAKGTHTARDDVKVEQAESFRIAFREPPAYETDGEYRRARAAELEVRCVPRALRLAVPAHAAGAGNGGSVSSA